MRLIPIEHDVYDIAMRLKELGAYKLYFNADRQRYEVHGKNGIELVCPYEQLDSRLVEYVLKTRVVRRDEILREIEDGNARQEYLNEREQRYYREDVLKDAIDYTTKVTTSGADIPPPTVLTAPN